MQAIRIILLLLLLLPLPARAAELTVLLPILKDEKGNAHLWDEANHWREAWEQYFAAADGSGVILPMGDLEDMGMIAAETIAAGNPSLETLAMKYEAQKVVIAEAAYDGSGLDITLSGDVTPQRLRVEGEYYAALQQGVMDTLQLLRPGAQMPLAAAPLPSLDGSGVSTLQVTLPLSGMDDWLQSKYKLESAKQMVAVNLKELRTTEAKLSLSYKGNFPSFTAGLNEQGFLLERDGTDWRLTIR